MSKLIDERMWERREGKTYAQGHAITPPGATWERKTPAQAQRREDVGSALLWAVGSWFVFGFLGLVLAIVKWEGEWLARGLVGGALIGALLWLALAVQWHRLLWKVERITGRDLDRDGHQGEPPRVVRVEIDERHAGGFSRRWGDLPVDEEKMVDVALAIDGGLLRELPGNNRELTPAGRAMMRQLLEG